MNNKLVERRSGEFYYCVDISTPSDIYFKQETIQKLSNDKCEFAITEISRYIREHSTSYHPVLLTWEMTSRCNLSCPFCYIRDNSISKEVSFEEAQEMIDYFVSEGLFEVYLSGGECLLLKDFLKIYRYFKEKGVFVTVFTNGTQITDEIFECWRTLPPSSVEITFYNDELSSAPFRNLLTLRDMGINVLPKFTLTNATISYYETVNNWMTENGFSLNVDSNLFEGLDEAHSGIAEKYSISNEQKKQYLLDRKITYGPEKKVRTGIGCKSRKGIIQISPDFSVSLCNKMKIRWNLRETKPDVALDELRKLIAKYENAVIHGCNGCIYSKNCSMCLVSAEMIDGKLYVPDGYCESIRKKSIAQS